MNAAAIVYVSNTGTTAAYAQMLGKRKKIPVYSLKEAEKALKKGNTSCFSAG